MITSPYSSNSLEVLNHVMYTYYIHGCTETESSPVNKKHAIQNLETTLLTKSLLVEWLAVLRSDIVDRLQDFIDPPLLRCRSFALGSLYQWNLSGLKTSHQRVFVWSSRD